MTKFPENKITRRRVEVGCVLLGSGVGDDDSTARLVRSKAFLQVSEGLPFVNFLLGDELSEDNQPTLEGGCDSMCGANIGNLAYHEGTSGDQPPMIVGRGVAERRNGRCEEGNARWHER